MHLVKSGSVELLSLKTTLYEELQNIIEKILTIIYRSQNMQNHTYPHAIKISFSIMSFIF
jgi:hypothetical protein